MRVGASRSLLSIGPYLLDLEAEKLWHGKREIRLRRKNWEVLVYLAREGGRLVPATELLDAVWGGASVSPQSVTNVVSELRKALGDTRKNSQYLETVSGRGVRLKQVAEVAREETGGASAPQQVFVDRYSELDELERCWRSACRGRRQLAFVVGEPGIGKTALVSAFTRRVHRDRATAGEPPMSVGHGHCVQQSGEPEPFSPILETLEHLPSWFSEAGVTAILREEAPSWLVQMPWLLSNSELQELRMTLAGSGAARMLREGARLLEALARERPLLIVVEDLHWADDATLELLDALAKRRGPAYLMIVATFRPVDFAASVQSLRSRSRALAAGNLATTVTLAPFGEKEIGLYLDERFGEVDGREVCARLLARHTRGNPLFLTSMTDDLVDKGRFVHDGAGLRFDADAAEHDDLLPDNLRDMIGERLAQLPRASVSLLEAASVAGERFAAFEVGAALDIDDLDVERQCHELHNEGRVIRFVGTRKAPSGNSSGNPSGNTSGSTAPQYEFEHALYRQALLERIAPTELQEAHRRIATRLEAASADRPGEEAARRARHWLAAGCAEQAESCFRLAGFNAAARLAYLEAAEHFRHAIEILQTFEDTAERARREAETWFDYSGTLLIVEHYKPGHEPVPYDHITTLAERAGDHELAFRAQIGLAQGARFRLSLDAAAAATDRCLEIALKHDRELLPATYLYRSMVSSARGRFPRALEYLDDAQSLPARAGIPRYFDLDLALAVHRGVVSTFLDEEGASQAAFARGLACARKTGRHNDQLIVSFFKAISAAVRCDWQAALSEGETVLAMAEEIDAPAYATMTRIMMVRAGGGELAQGCAPNLAEAIEARGRVSGETWWDSLFHCWQAEACMAAGHHHDALAAVGAGLAVPEHEFEAELWRLRGQAYDRIGDRVAAEEALRTAATIAREQGNRLFEARLGARASLAG